jgi:hypothetical protein
VLGAATADDDGDGLTNDEERVFGLNPLSGSSSNPISVPFNPTTGTLSFTRRDLTLSGHVNKVWYSTTLMNWQEDAGALITPGTLVNGVQTVAVKLSDSLLTQPKLFVRITSEPATP